MPIDCCPHSFRALAGKVLPARMREMRATMKKPLPMKCFAIDGVGVKTILSDLGRSEDFSACYVMLSRGRPVYVGISRKVISRLRQHVRGTTHFDASLAYRMAEAKNPHDQQRSEAMRRPAFKKEFLKAQSYLKGLQVAIVEIPDDLELYLFEVYCSMELDTAKWNTFKTH